MIRSTIPPPRWVAIAALILITLAGCQPPPAIQPSPPNTSVFPTQAFTTSSPPTITPVSPQQADPKAEHQALVALYQSTGGEKWIDQTGWLSDQPICTWYGLTCDGGHITGIDLSGNNLDGTLPAEIGQMKDLRTLNLEFNWITQLPPEIGGLTSLQELNLANNMLTAIPPEIGQLTSLQTLDLGNAQTLSTAYNGGNLPPHRNSLKELPPEIGGLTSLRDLNLRGNNFAWLPPEIGQLTNLQTLDLSNNSILWALPDEIEQLKNLKTLNLSEIYHLRPLSAGICRLPHLDPLPAQCTKPS